IEIERYDRYERQIANFYNNRQVASLSNNNTLTNNINELNQTLINNDQNKNDLVNLRNQKYNTLLYDTIESEIKEDNDKQLFEDSEKYDLLIQTLKQSFLDSLHTVEQLQYLKKQLLLERRIILNRKKIDNVNDAFKPLVKNQAYLNKIDKILEKDNLDEMSDNKKQKQASRRMKKIRENI
ncbi:3151_t:CDS:2, partial [Cetraspora pellucida]